MTFETAVFDVLSTVAERVFPDFAPVSTPHPYVTYQQIGGPVLTPLDGGDPGVRMPELQINVWDSTRTGAMALMQDIELAMRAAMAFQAVPLSAASADFDPDSGARGARQDFRCRYPA